MSDVAATAVGQARGQNCGNSTGAERSVAAAGCRTKMPRVSAEAALARQGTSRHVVE